MPDQFLLAEPDERRAVYAVAAAGTGLPPKILEKDVWLCWTLDVLFSQDGRPQMAFKGGTSLSKVYGVIDRFSEDIDITIALDPDAKRRAPRIEECSKEGPGTARRPADGLPRRGGGAARQLCPRSVRRRPERMRHHARRRDRRPRLPELLCQGRRLPRRAGQNGVRGPQPCGSERVPRNHSVRDRLPHCRGGRASSCHRRRALGCADILGEGDPCP